MAEPNRNPQDENEENFFETLGATADRYNYRDAADEESGEQETQHVADAKLTAIITLVLVVLVAIAMGVLMLRGIDTIKGAMPPSSNSSGALEL